MFGLLDIQTCGLKNLTRRFYACNVCNALASRYGAPSRLALSNDAVYLSLLIASQRDAVPYLDEIKPNKCQPWSKRSICLPEFEYPAAVSLLTCGVRLLDQARDEDSFSGRTLWALGKSRIGSAETKLRELGLRLPSIDHLVEEQHIRESTGGKEPYYYSQITEETYSKIFAHTANLAGESSNAQLMGEVGSHVGRIAYLLDNYLDLENDKTKGAFNVYNNLSTAFANTSPSLLLENCANASLNAIRKAILRVRFYRFERAVRYTTTDGLQAKVQSLLTEARIVSRPVMFSLAPVFVVMALKTVLLSHPLSSGGEDCCSCDCCSGGGSSASGGDIGSNSMVNLGVGAIVGPLSGALLPPLFNQALSMLHPKAPDSEPTPDEGPYGGHIESGIQDPGSFLTDSPPPLPEHEDEALQREMNNEVTETDRKLTGTLEQDLPPSPVEQPAEAPQTGSEQTIQFTNPHEIPDPTYWEQEKDPVKRRKKQQEEREGNKKRQKWLNGLSEEDRIAETNRLMNIGSIQDEYIGIMRDRPDFMKRIDEQARAEAKANGTIWTDDQIVSKVSDGDLKTMSTAERTQYDQWVKRYDSFTRRHGSNTNTLQTADGRYNRKEFSSTTGRRG